PTHVSGGSSHHPPSTPIGGLTPPTFYSPPAIPVVTPGTPVVTRGTPVVLPGTPTPRFGFDPNSPPFTCNFWRTNPAMVWRLLGYLGTLGNAFGISTFPGFGPRTNALQALSNTRNDGYGELYREGTAALLNAMTHTRFPFTATEVRNGFAAALASEKDAATQAQLFKLANEGR
ncbi:hypothetical protein M569_07441, partial [Genlisea aurea]